MGESRSELGIWSELVRRIDPEKHATYFEGWTRRRRSRRSSRPGDFEGGPTQGITLEQLKAGPVRLNVPDPDIPFLAQVDDLAPFPPPSPPSPIEATQVFLPTRRIELYKEEDRFLELGEQVVTYKDPYDDGVHDPAEFPLALLIAALEVADPLDLLEQRLARGDPRRPPQVLIEPGRRRRPRHRRRRRDRGLQLARVG